MGRTTKAMLNSRVDRLNVVLNRPKTAYTRDSEKRLHPNGGHFLLEGNNPGDGWTRYGLYEMLESGGQSNVSPTLNASEMWAYLRGVFDVLDSEYTHRFDNPKTVELHKELVSACRGALACLVSGDLTPEMATKRLRDVLAKIDGE